MALVTTFGYTNNDTPEHPISMLSNYTLLNEDPGVCVYDNKTCPIDQPEQVTIKGFYTTKSNSELAYKPKPAIAGPNAFSQFLIKLDLMSKTVDSETGDTVEQNPVTFYAVGRIPRTVNISDDLMQTAWGRLNSLTYDNAGVSRLGDWRRLGLRITHD